MTKSRVFAIMSVNRVVNKLLADTKQPWLVQLCQQSAHKNATASVFTYFRDNSANQWWTDLSSVLTTDWKQKCNRSIQRVHWRQKTRKCVPSKQFGCEMLRTCQKSPAVLYTQITISAETNVGNRFCLPKDVRWETYFVFENTVSTIAAEIHQHQSADYMTKWRQIASRSIVSDDDKLTVNTTVALLSKHCHQTVYTKISR